MKTLLTLILIAVALVASGCASKTIEAASTKLSVGSPMGRNGSLELPKNLKAEEIAVDYDPETKAFSFRAKNIETDSASVIERAGAVQAEAVGKLADTVSTLVPLIAPAAK